MANVITKDKRWINGIVPFAFDIFDFPDEIGPTAMGIKDAIKTWNNIGSKVMLKKRTNEPTFILFKINTYTTSGGSDVGMGHGIQIIWASRTAKSTRESVKSQMLHEIGHALGLYHEACRQDHYDFINIDFDNIIKIPLTTYYDNQFYKTPGGIDAGSYDFDSIMHYGSFDYAKDPKKPVITKKNGALIVQPTSLSAGDISAIKDLYSDIDQPQQIINLNTGNAVQPAKRVIQPPPVTIDPPPVTIAPPPVHVTPPAITITPAKMKVKPPAVKFMGQNVPVPEMEVQPPAVTIYPPAINVSPAAITIDPPPVTVTPPPIVIY